MRASWYRRSSVFALFAFIATPAALAHVKWFSAYSYSVRPLGFIEVATPLFWFLALGAVLTVTGMVVLDQRLTTLDWYDKLGQTLTQYANNSDLIVRVAVGAVLLFCWQAGNLLVPELPARNVVLELSQLILGCLILANRLLKYAGWGVIALYFIGVFELGWLHMLDYVYIVGAGYYLLATPSESARVQDTRLPALYASVGFSLCWAALEKLVYPGWAESVFAEHPYLLMNMDVSFFLPAAAFVEFAFGFMLLVCLLQRVMALIITGLFISTTLVFGKVEFVGHAIVHAALIVFILRGAGERIRTPITFFYHMHQRLAFTILGFSMALVVLLGTYCHFAMNRYEIAQATQPEEHAPMFIETSAEAMRPEIQLLVEPDAMGGWNVNVQTTNFTFAPGQSGQPHTMGEGHAHLYIDDEKAARLYGDWYHIPELPPGSHELRVTLNTNNHAIYVYEGMPITDAERILVGGD